MTQVPTFEELKRMSPEKLEATIRNLTCDCEEFFDDLMSEPILVETADAIATIWIHFVRERDRLHGAEAYKRFLPRTRKDGETRGNDGD